MVRETLGDQRPEHPLDLEVDRGDEIDRAFLVDSDVAAEARDLDVAGAKHGLDGGGQQERVERAVQARCGSFLTMPHLHAAFGDAPHECRP